MSGQDCEVFDPHGDVFLKIFTQSLVQHRLLRVSSQVLCLASPVFMAMVGPSSPFKEANALHEHHRSVIPLGGDDGDALVILMNAAHLRGHLVPAKVSFDMLYQIAVLCDKYDMTQIILPWTFTWANMLTPFARHDGNARVLVVAWVFRLNLIFSIITREFIYNTKPQEHQLEPYRKYIDMDIHLVPDTVIDAIGVGRSSVISSIFALCEDHIAKYTTAASEGVNLCSESRDFTVQNECDSQQAGALLGHLTCLGFYPVQREMDTRSVDEIMSGFAVKDKTKNMALGAKHAPCCALDRMEEEVRDLVEDAGGLRLSDFLPRGLQHIPDYVGEYYDDRPWSGARRTLTSLEECWEEMQW